MNIKTLNQYEVNLKNTSYDTVWISKKLLHVGYESPD